MKTFYKIILGIILVTGQVKLFGQQDPMYSMYMFDKALINPAYAGSSNWAIGTIKYRNQFTGLSAHPTTQTINFHSPIQRKHIGVGLKVINDKNAIIHNINIGAQFSYHLNFAGGKLSVGLEAGIYNRKINFQKLILNDLNDNAIPGTSKSSLTPDVSYGVYYQKKQFYTGFSQSHLIKGKFNYGENERTSRLYSHYYFIVGNVFDINKTWSVEPSILLKKQASVAPQIDLNAMLYYDEKIGVGLQYRTRDALVAVLKVNISESIRIAYSYDLTLSKLANYSKGSHEIIISYGIKLPPPPTQKEIHPRYYF
ncbi:MAG: type IX secretion system membrane protein PorP/SprF [Bacteroidota bacterium]